MFSYHCHTHVVVLTMLIIIYLNVNKNMKLYFRRLFATWGFLNKSMKIPFIIFLLFPLSGVATLQRHIRGTMKKGPRNITGWPGVSRM